VLFGAGCATTTPAPSSGRDGMDRVSPVRAAEVNTRLGIGYLERDQIRLAIEKLETALTHDPSHTPAHLTLAMIYEQLGDAARAGQYYSQAARLAPEDGATQNAYAVYLCRRGDFELANQHFERAMSDPFYATPELAYGNAGACARRANQPAQAEVYLRQALDIDPDYPDALFQLAELYLQRGESFRARAFLQRLESVVAPDASMLILGYRIEQGLSNPGQADQYAARLERQFPESAQARELRSLRQEDD
jgi:type IV pilus assembly protein PilF